MKEAYLEIAIIAALKAGNDILKIYNDPQSDFEIERKADNSPLTIADKTAHKTIISYLNQTPFPILSEEGQNIPYQERKNWETLWFVDPLDGTKEFIKRNGEFTVNIALINKGVPILGVIYIPVKKSLYFSTETIGSYKITDIEYKETVDWSSIRTQGKKLPFLKKHKNTIIVASRSHLSTETESFIENIKKQNKNIEIISSGSSIKICLVAEGTADIYPRFAPTMEWDTAAGHAIAKGAGKEIYQAGENVPLIYNKENLLNPWFIVEQNRIKI